MEYRMKKEQRETFKRIAFRYLSGEISIFLLDIYFVAEIQNDIVRTIKELSDLIR